MHVCNPIRSSCSPRHLVDAALAGLAGAETRVKFSLDFAGPSAPFVIGPDAGYDKAEALDGRRDPSARRGPHDRPANIADRSRRT